MHSNWPTRRGSNERMGFGRGQPVALDPCLFTGESIHVRSITRPCTSFGRARPARCVRGGALGHPPLDERTRGSTDVERDAPPLRSGRVGRGRGGIERRARPSGLLTSRVYGCVRRTHPTGGIGFASRGDASASVQARPRCSSVHVTGGETLCPQMTTSPRSRRYMKRLAKAMSRRSSTRSPMMSTGQ